MALLGRSGKLRKLSVTFFGLLILLIGFGLVVDASAAVRKASIPSHVTDDTVIHQELREIDTKRSKKPNFDRSISKLSSLESRYRERLPLDLERHPRLKGPVNRVQKRAYRSGKAQGTRKASRLKNRRHSR
jgi:hypothetical protein